MESNTTCRCCLSESCYKNISSAYYHSGKQEIYSEMLLRTLNISLSCNILESSLICEECIRKLRDATAFKEQVLQVEDIIIKQFSKELQFKHEKLNADNTIDIKIESDNLIFADSHQYEDINEKGSDEERILKDELLHDEDLKEIIHSSRRTRSKTEFKTKKAVKKKVRVENGVDTKRTRRLKERNTKLSTKHYEPSELQLTLRENSLTLINNSNLCLFRSLKTHFGCFYCKETFRNIPELRNHSEGHTTDKQNKRSVSRLTGTSCRNVDITSLTCKNCSEPCDNLDKLEQHLTEKHKLNFSNEKHLLIPFRIDDNLSCVICNESFQSYCKLYTHMHKHSNVSVCETCGKSFSSRVNLRLHLSSVHKTHKCSICLEELSSSYAKYKHMVKYHNKISAKKYHCSECDKVFKYPYQLHEHRIKDHGYKRKAIVCKDCGKKFSMHQNLITHIRGVHKKERNHPCSKCDMRFFTKNDQKRHQLSHDNVRSFSCDYCEAKFKTKDSWRRHMKRQHEQLYNG